MAEYYKGAAAATKANIKASAGRVLTFRVTNINAAVRYFQIHNKATAPAGADTALRSYIIPAGTATAPASLTLDLDYLVDGIRCDTGIGFAISTTDTTFTDSATASEHIVDINFN
jgi:hypothetical protein